MPLQDGHGHGKIVGVAVVKRDGSSARGQPCRAQHFHRLVQGQHVEPAGKPAQHAIKPGGVRFVRKNRVGHRQDAMKDQDRQLRAPSGRGEYAQQRPQKAHAGFPANAGPDATDGCGSRAHSLLSYQRAASTTMIMML